MSSATPKNILRLFCTALLRPPQAIQRPSHLCVVLCRTRDASDRQHRGDMTVQLTPFTMGEYAMAHLPGEAAELSEAAC